MDMLSKLSPFKKNGNRYKNAEAVLLERIKLYNDHELPLKELTLKTLHSLLAVINGKEKPDEYSLRNAAFLDKEEETTLSFTHFSTLGSFAQTKICA